MENKEINEIADIAKALMNFQAEDIVITKNKSCIDKYGKEKYKFADFDGILKTIKPYMKKHQLSFSQPIFGDSEKVTVKTILMHTSGQMLISEISVDLEKNKNQYMTSIQSEGTLITYLRRYSLSSILGLSSENDTDGNTPESENNDKKPTTPKPPSQEDAKKQIEYFKQIGTMIHDMTNKDAEKSKTILELFTSFIGKDGKFIKGTQNSEVLKKYSLARLKTTRDKVKTVWDRWHKGEAIEMLEDELKTQLGLKTTNSINTDPINIEEINEVKNVEPLPF
ncbi:MAG: ERF family protein [Candidatus Thorarchaeota archaeon]